MGQEMVVEGDLGAAAGRSGTYFVAKTPRLADRNLAVRAPLDFKIDRLFDSMVRVTHFSPNAKLASSSRVARRTLSERSFLRSATKDTRSLS